MTEVGYKYLKTYQLSVVLFLLGSKFCDIYFAGFDSRRTKEQAIQALRSHKQNIVEGYLEKSLKSYIKLLGVSIASLEEFIEDLLDFLRVRNLKIWDKNDPLVLKIRDLRVFGDFREDSNFPKVPELPDNPEGAANFLLTLAHQQSFMLSKQIKSLEEKFINEGGYTENLFKKRLGVKLQHDY